MKPSAFVLLFVVFVTACIDAREPEGLASLREQVAEAPPLSVAASSAAGSIVASRRSDGDWREAIVALGVERGTLVLGVDATGAITVDELALDLAPIALPEDLLGRPAEFTQVHAALRAPATATTTWLGADAARATAMVELELAWSLAIGGATIPIFAPDLPPLPLVIDLDGDGHVIAAGVKLVARGELWSWAGLVRLDELRLAVSATTE